MIRRLGLPLAVALALPAGAISMPAVASAQSLTSGVVSGEVTDGAIPLGGVVVTLTDAAGGIEVTQETGGDGRFRFDLLQPGEYVIRAERFGYRPKRVSQIPVRGGASVVLEIDLVESPPPVEETDEVVYRRGSVLGPPVGLGTGVGPLELRRLPSHTGQLADLPRFLSRTDGSGGALGLPAGLTGLAVDGHQIGLLDHPQGGRGRLATAAFPLEFFDEVAFLETDMDVEWGGSAGAMVHGTSIRGSRDFQAEGFGSWTSAPLRGGEFLPDDLPDHQDGHATGIVRGYIIPDTAHFAVGFHARRHIDVVPPSLDPERAGDQALRDAISGVSGGALAPFWTPEALEWNTASVFSRVDWQVTGNHGISARVHGARVVASDGDVFPDAWSGRGTRVEGTDIFTNASLTSRLSERFGMELRVGVEFSDRDYEARRFSSADGAFSGVVPATTAATVGSLVGSGLDGAGEFSRRTLRATEAFHFRLGTHQLKFGMGVAASNHSRRSDFEREGVFRFGDPSGLTAREGAFHQRIGPTGQTSFSVSEFSLFAQDTWSPVPGLEVMGGVRLEREGAPLDDIRVNTEWLELTGIDNRAVAASARTARVSPRFAFSWDVGNRNEFIVSGATGVHTQGIHPGVLEEILSNTGPIRMRRGLGQLERWPQAPDSVAAPIQGQVLSILGPNYQGPRTQKASLGVRWLLTEATSVRLSGNFTRAEFLPRRRDLNRISPPREEDQFGRPVYGELVRMGELLAVRPGTDRRFGGFDQVSVIEADGWAEHLGLTVGVEHRLPGVFEFFSSYTFGQTTDNRPGGVVAGAPLFVTPNVGGPEAHRWVEGDSDLSIPHRWVAGAEVTLPLIIPVRIGGRYHGHVGFPFTPTFRPGVQASGQVGAGSEPAYVAAIPEMDELASHWDCLADQFEQWAARNSCRGPVVHDLDFRLTVGFLEADWGWAELVLDGLNLLGRDGMIPDPALYRIDPGRDLARNPAEGTVTVPLRVNQDFGEPLFRTGSTRTFRIGLKAGF